MRVRGFVVLCAMALAGPGGAQVRASERGSVSQTVDGTVITLDYSRPQARGRNDLFGKVVSWGHMWTPGANWATTLELNRSIRINGQDVPAGKYSVWFVPRQRGLWTVHLNKNPRLFHTRGPKPEDQFLTIGVLPRRGNHTEILTFDFPRVTPEGATLRMRWGRTELDLDVGVGSSRPVAGITPERMAPYLGSYTMTATGDTAVSMVEIVNAGGALRAVVEGSWPFTWELIPTDEPHRFLPAFMDKGKIVDVEDAAPLIFELENGVAKGFRVMGIEEVWMTATRRPPSPGARPR